MEKKTIFDTKNKIKTIFNTKSPSLSFLFNQALPFALNLLHSYFLLQSGPPLFSGRRTARWGLHPRRAPQTRPYPAPLRPPKPPSLMACSRAAIASTELKLGRQRPATSRPSQAKPPSRGVSPPPQQPNPTLFPASKPPEQGPPRRSPWNAGTAAARSRSELP